MDNCYFNSLTKIYVARQVDICPLFQPYLLHTSRFCYNWKIVHTWDLWNQILCFSWKWTCIMQLKHSNLPEIVWNEWVLESLVVFEIPQLREETHIKGVGTTRSCSSSWTVIWKALPSAEYIQINLGCYKSGSWLRGKCIVQQLHNDHTVT